MSEPTQPDILGTPEQPGPKAPEVKRPEGPLGPREQNVANRIDQDGDPDKVFKDIADGRAEAPNKPPKNEWIIGAKVNPDGSLDLSRAGRLVDPEKWDAAVQRTEANKQARALEDERKMVEAAKTSIAKLREGNTIPADVKPGSVNMAWYRLRNSINMQSIRSIEARWISKNPEAESQAELARHDAEVQKAVLEHLMTLIDDKIYKDDSNEGQKVSSEQMSREQRWQATKDFSATDAQKLLYDFQSQMYEKMQKEGGDKTTSLEGTIDKGGKAYSHNEPFFKISEVYQGADKLMSRLVSEAQNK